MMFHTKFRVLRLILLLVADFIYSSGRLQYWGSAHKRVILHLAAVFLSCYLLSDVNQVWIWLFFHELWKNGTIFGVSTNTFHAQM